MGQILILGSDVQNLRPDRRKKRDGWAVPVWKKGSRWEEVELRGYGPDPEERITCVRPLNVGYASARPWCHATEQGIFRSMFTVKKATTWRDVALEEGDWGNLASDVLEVLIRREAVSLDEVREALRWYLDQPEEDR